MPYTVKKQGSKYVVYKKSTGKRVGATKGDKESLRKYLAALHINAKENKINMIKLKTLIKEELNTKETFKEFAETRYNGAEKIANTAKEKGGVAMLTYNHFIVKLPYYDKANTGKFNVEEGIKEYNELVKQLSASAKTVNYTMTVFQKLVGKIEVLGELIIKSK